MADIKSLLQPAIKFLQLEKINQNKEGGNNQAQGVTDNKVSFQKTDENELQECNFEADMKAGSFNFENNANQAKAEENNMQVQDAGNAQNNAGLKEQGQAQGMPENNSAPKTEESAKDDKIKGPENTQESKNEGQNNFFSSKEGEGGLGFNEELAAAFKELEKIKNGS